MLLRDDLISMGVSNALWGYIFYGRHHGRFGSGISNQAAAVTSSLMHQCREVLYAAYSSRKSFIFNL